MVKLKLIKPSDDPNTWNFEVLPKGSKVWNI